MSKKKALFYTLEPLRGNERYVTMHFYDKRERRMMSSVDLLLNVEYLTEEAIAAFVRTR